MSELKDLKVGDPLVIKAAHGLRYADTVVTKVTPTGRFYVKGSDKCFNPDGWERTTWSSKMRAFRPDSQELADSRECARMSEMHQEWYKVVDHARLLIKHELVPKHQAERFDELLVEIRDLLGIEV